eukprot:TRINITY_DN30337_c0_g1_i1.p1 TRINITY_DN30337_c0_g1~~TRINITY_DN30337_c0_g1_i1.p1  ORF type:complete len:1272 (+),score=408.63 TRINITY_DN30337_c0_g1_i1:41-3856(+)
MPAVGVLAAACAVMGAVSAVGERCTVGVFVIEAGRVEFDRVHKHGVACHWASEADVAPPRHGEDGEEAIVVYGEDGALLDMTSDPRWVHCAPPLDPDDVGAGGGRILRDSGVFEAVLPTALYHNGRSVLFSLPPDGARNHTVALHAGMSSRRRGARALQSDDPEFEVLQQAGPTETQNNVVILSGGYTKEQKARFIGDAEQLLGYMQIPPTEGFVRSVPFARYTSMLNVFTVWQESPQTGASKPKSGRQVNNNLDCQYGDGQSSPERMLTCNSDKVQALANFAPCGADGRQNVVVVTLVNDGDYGGAATHHKRNDKNNTIYRHAWFFNGYLQNKQDPNSDPPTRGDDYASLYFHEVGHAYSNLNDEYDIGANEPSGRVQPQKNCELAENVNNPKWQEWISAASTDPYMSVASQPVSVCGYRRWFKPSTECLMEKLGASRLCPVCREASTLSFYDTKQDITNPRCPQAGEIVLLEPGESVNLFVNKRLGTLGDFRIVWRFGGASVVATKGATVLRVTACAGSSGCGGVDALPVGEHKITLTVTDNTDFVRSRVPEMEVTTEYQVQVVAAGQKDNLKEDDERDCHSGEEKKLFEAMPVTQQVKHWSRCDPDTTKTCKIEYKSRLYQKAADLDDLSDTLEKHIFGIVGACVGGLLAIFLLVWCCLMRDNNARAKCIFKEERPAYLERIRWIMIGSAVVFILGAIAVIVLALVYYRDLGAIGKILVFGGLIIAVILLIMAFVGFTGAWYRSKYGLSVNGGILFLCVLISLAWTVFAIIFHSDVKPSNASAGDQGIAAQTDGGSVDDRENAAWSHKWLRDIWAWLAESHDDMLCSLQQTLECSGWYRSCVLEWDEQYCPQHCEAVHAQPYAHTRCEARVVDSFEDNFTIIIVISVLVTLSMIIGLVFNFMLRNSIGKYRKKATGKLEDRKRTGGKKQKAEHFSQRRLSKHPTAAHGAANPLVGGSGKGTTEAGESEAKELLEVLFALTPDEKEKLKQEFVRVDKKGNKNGKLDRKEFRLFMKSALLIKVSPEGAEALFQIFDQDANGEITMEEFCDVLKAEGDDALGATFGALGATGGAPPGFASDWREATDDKGRAYYWNKKTKETTRELYMDEMSPDWREAQDQHGRPYYWHRTTKETTRHLGPDHYVKRNRLTGELAPQADGAFWGDGPRASFCADDSVKPVDPMNQEAAHTGGVAKKTEWREATDGKGRPYYWHRTTKETTRQLWREEGNTIRNLLTDEVRPNPASPPAGAPPQWGSPQQSPQAPLLHNTYW